MYLLFLGVLLFFLFLQLKIPEGFEIWKEYKGMDYWGNDIAHGVNSLRDCKKRCISIGGCNGFTTDSVNGAPGNCWIKNDLRNATPVNHLTSYRLSRP